MSVDVALLSVALTLVAYELAERAFRRSGRRAIFNPLLVGVLIVVPALRLLGVSYDRYFAGAQPIHFLLGPATVALAIPLYEQRHRVRAALLPLLCATVVGSAAGVIGIAAVLLAFGQRGPMLAAAAPTHATTPVAMSIAEQSGGDVSVAAAVTLVTGIFGAVTAPALMSFAQRRLSPAARGFALGLSSTGCGVARALDDGDEPGAFAGLAIGLNALATALIVPAVLRAVGMIG